MTEGGELDRIMSIGSLNSIARLACLLLAFISFYLLTLGFGHAPCWSLIIIVALAAWPIWQYQRERFLIHRQAVLAHVSTPQSGLRRWFWKGQFTQMLLVLAALFWAVPLLSFASLLTKEQWVILAGNVMFVWWLTGAITRRMGDQIQRSQLSAVTRQWPIFLLNLVFLVSAFTYVDFAISGAPDTRDLAWAILAETTFIETSSEYACSIAGWPIAAVATAESLAWHAAQIIIPTLKHQELKWLAWCAFLMPASVFAYLFTRFVLGSVAIAESMILTSSPNSGFSEAFFLTIFLLVLPYLYAMHTLSEFDFSQLAEEAQEVVELGNPCQFDDMDSSAFSQEVDRELSENLIAAQTLAERRIDYALNQIFAEMDPGVDAYLDWYFTVIGEYQRLWSLTQDDFADLMTTRLQSSIFKTIDFENRIEAVVARVSVDSQERMLNSAQLLRTLITAETEAKPCLRYDSNISVLDSLERDRLRATIATSSGAAVVGAAGTKVLASKVSSATVAKLFGKKSVQLAAGLAGKVTAKKGGSILLSSTGATLACAPGGPLALVCGVAAGVVTWFTVDKAAVEIDELRFREEMRNDILSTLAEEKKELASLLKAQNKVRLEIIASEIKKSTDAVFIPIRDGI